MVTAAVSYPMELYRPQYLSIEGKFMRAPPSRRMSGFWK